MTLYNERMSLLKTTRKIQYQEATGWGSDCHPYKFQNLYLTNSSYIDPLVDIYVLMVREER